MVRIADDCAFGTVAFGAHAAGWFGIRSRVDSAVHNLLLPQAFGYDACSRLPGRTSRHAFVRHAVHTGHIAITAHRLLAGCIGLGLQLGLPRWFAVTQRTPAFALELDFRHKISALRLLFIVRYLVRMLDPTILLPIFAVGHLWILWPILPTPPLPLSRYTFHTRYGHTCGTFLRDRFSLRATLREHTARAGFCWQQVTLRAVGCCDILDVYSYRFWTTDRIS